MRHIDRNSLPHLIDVFFRKLNEQYFTLQAGLATRWWGVNIGSGCSFSGRCVFRRYPTSLIIVGENCRFNSSATSNLIGVNRPCIISTLTEDAKLIIGKGCGFSGTVISAFALVELKENVRCGANTLITDSDWHLDDSRAGKPAPILIDENVWLGEGVKVLKDVHIGANSVIGAGSVVTKNVPSNVFAAGNPCRVIRDINHNAEK